MSLYQVGRRAGPAALEWRRKLSPGKDFENGLCSVRNSCKEDQECQQRRVNNVEEKEVLTFITRASPGKLMGSQMERSLPLGEDLSFLAPAR